jgi:hypothetical protein
MKLNTLGAYVIGVVIVLAVLVSAGWILRGTAGALIYGRFAGAFLLGMLAMYIATRVYPR